MNKLKKKTTYSREEDYEFHHSTEEQDAVAGPNNTLT